MKRFRIAVAGCGGISKLWIDYALSREDAEIVALVDIKEEFARKAAILNGLECKVYTEILEAIRDSSANLVFNITIPESHIDVVTAGLQAGCDVLGEKPMACSMEDAHKMTTLAEKSGKMYAVMQNGRYNKNIRLLKDLLITGSIGRIGFTCADFFVGPHFGGFRDIMESPLLLDMAIHTFDQARFIIGADPVSVYCHEFNPAGSWYKGNAAAICIFELSDGSVFNYRGSWCAEGCPTSWEASWRVMGSGGTATWDGEKEPYFEAVAALGNINQYYDSNGTEPVRTKPIYIWNGNEGHAGCLDEMFQALLEGRKAETDCTDNIKSVAMVLGALESARRREKIILSY